MAVIDRVAGGKDSSSADSVSILASARQFLRHAFGKFFEPEQARLYASMETIKKFNGSECVLNSSGLISHLKDAEGRNWEFAYIGKRIVSFRDCQGHLWKERDGSWVSDNSGNTETPQRVSLDQSTGDVLIDDARRSTYYKPDGTTVVEVVQQRDGESVRVLFTEFATRPHRAFVVVEEGDKLSRRVTYIQDANAKLYKFEYENDKLARYIDMSTKPAVVWTAEYDSRGKLSGWFGHNKADGTAVGAMAPMLESVDLVGNRHFRRADGYRFTVGPSGAACSNDMLGAAFVSGQQPVITFSSLDSLRVHRS